MKKNTNFEFSKFWILSFICKIKLRYQNLNFTKTIKSKNNTKQVRNLQLHHLLIFQKNDTNEAKITNKIITFHIFGNGFRLHDSLWLDNLQR